MFWMIYCPTGPWPPSVEHRTLREAKAEAERLARANPGHRFFVLSADAVVTFNPVVWEELASDEVPF